MKHTKIYLYSIAGASVDMLDIISKISNYRYSSRAKAVSLKKINIYSLCLTTHGVYVNLSLKGAITF